MNAMARAAGMAVLGCCVALGPLGLPVADGQTPVEQVTTDTPEYCLHLLERLRQIERGRPPSQDVAFLSDEGRRMCDHGQVRAGITRLRRAMQIMLGSSAER
jgi:predicted small lipoprotein YifL